MKIFLRTKTFLFTSLCLMLAGRLYSQETPLFQAVIHFEDAVGNRDSVTVGFDPEATYDIDPQFGEVEITTPFDSVLETRAVSVFDFDQKMSKVIIDESEFIPIYNCSSGPLIHIFVWAKYQPLKVTWDSTLFLTEKCARSSFLSNHQIDEFAGPFDLDSFPPVCACMAALSTYTFDLTQEGLDALNIYEGFEVSKQWEVEGLGTQTVLGLRFKPHFQGGYTPCYWVTAPVGTEESTAALPLTIFPNPSRGLFQIGTAAEAPFDVLRVFDAQGSLVRHWPHFNQTALDLSALPNGIYHVQASDQHGKRYVGRVLKL